MRTEVLDDGVRRFEHHRAAGLVSRGTVFGRALRLESDGIEKLRAPGCVRISVRRAHSAEDAVAVFHSGESVSPTVMNTLLVTTSPAILGG